MITRTADTDDDGTGTTGTVLNNAWKTAIYDAVDAADAQAKTCFARLTLTSGTPVTTADVTGAASVYVTPYGGGNSIALYDGVSVWSVLTFAELTLALGTKVNAQAYDVFAYNNAGVVAVEALEWANATITMTIAAPGVVTWTAHGMATGNSITFTTTSALPTGVTANTQYWITVVDANTFKLSTSLATVAAGTFITTSGSQSGVHTGHQPQARATALTRQDGVLVKSGATTRRYLGSFMTTSTTTTEDSATKRKLWNLYHRARRPLLRVEPAASWTYTLAALRQANANTANQVEVLIGWAEALLSLTVTIAPSTSVTSNCAIGIGEDATTVISAGSTGAFATVASGTILPLITQLERVPAVGHHAYVWLEWATALGTTTWYTGNAVLTGINSGLNGWVEG